MKKILSTLLAGVMITVCSSSVYASDIKNSAVPQQGEAVITTEIAPSFIVNIPVDTDVAFNTVNSDFGAVELTKAQLEPDKCIKVTLATDGTLKNIKDHSKIIPYQIYEGNVYSVSETLFSSAEYMAVGDKTDLAIHIESEDWNNAYAGQYSDTVTFTIEYISITS